MKIFDYDVIKFTFDEGELDEESAFDIEIDTDGEAMTVDVDVEGMELD